MSSRSHKLRSYASRLRTENRRLTELSVAMREGGFPLIASDIYKLAVKAGTFALALSHTADVVRDPRGAGQRR
jgi:hypothetical protein